MSELRRWPVAKRIGMGPKNAEVFIENNVPYVRIGLKKACYVTYVFTGASIDELREDLADAETEAVTDV